MQTVAIIQARMASTRLPGKVLATIAGRPMLAHVVDRARQATTLDMVAVATSTEPKDDPVAEFCLAEAVPAFRGSETDVLDRYYRAAQHFSAEVIVRLTADCPLLDPGVIDAVVDTFRAGSVDYVSNTLELTYPDGLDTEVFHFSALAEAWRSATWRSEREHVTSYFYKHPDLFRLGSVRHREDLSTFRWTVDEPHDLDFARAVYRQFAGVRFGLTEVTALLQDHPEIAQLNAGFTRNEGYQRSLCYDSMVVEAREQ